MATIGKNLRRLRTQAGMSQQVLAEKAGVSRQLVSQIERDINERSIEIPALARALGVNIHEIDESYRGIDSTTVKTAKIVGRAGAATDGRVVYADSNEGLGSVILPVGAPDGSVAVEVEGYSMGFLADGALIFYSERFPAPTDDMLGTIVIVGLEDGSVLMKRLLRGSGPGLYDLESINGPMLRDKRIEWAAHIDNIVPPWRARRLRIESEEVRL